MTVIIIITSISLVFSLLSFCTIIKLIKSNNELSRIVYFFYKKYKITTDVIDEILATEKEILLLSSVELNKKDQRSDTKIMPNPSISKMITETAEELISVELTLTRHLKIQPRTSLEKIIKDVTRTYPYVDETYISRQCIAMFENINRQSE